ncbi:MAG: type II secretion system F family protein [Hydrogenophaga sp.]|uniref:type II secretion system F family protein n=1 Tax=Hydrogenophaga sp. TaxID=1904254 RepID=UPI002ABBCD88|nr:type II secretion system F family protein [Hydrogenophaga sp.]MDZ4187685.1 type II secretion system F family protein [Hydrogenophaga sp.]
MFKYQATSSDGRRSKGTLESADTRAALATLATQGLKVFALEAAGPAGGKVPASSGPKPSDKTPPSAKLRIAQEEVLLCIQELSTLLNAGIPLADAMLNIARGHEGRPMGAALNASYVSLRSGSSLAVALKTSGLNLPEYVHELVKAGEETGKLGASLQSASQQMESDAVFRRETRNALTYPMVLIASGLLATLVVFVFVVPKFANILTNPKADIPAFSRWVLHAGLWLVNNKIFAGVIAASTVTGAWLALSKQTVRDQLWEIATTLPVMGRWIDHVELARWASMFSVLLQHHVPLLDALRHSQNSLAGRAWRNKAELIARDVRAGQGLAAAMQTHHFLDSVGLNLVRVGEQSGKLAHTTASLAQMHRTHAQQSMKQFLILLEPVTILLVSVLLGGIMISVMLAITSLTNVI